MITLIFLILVFLLNNNYIYNFIWSTDNLFQDLIMPVKWLECFRDGFDIFKSDVCAGGTFAYGPIFLNLPINETLKIFNLQYLPYLSIFLLTTFIVTSINKNTLLSILAKENANEQQLLELQTMRNMANPLEKVKTAKELFDQLNVKETCLEVVKDYHSKAMDSLSKIETTKDKSTLISLTDSLLNREF